MSTNVELQEIKKALTALPKGSSRRIAPELRLRVAMYARSRIAEGAARAAIARALGVSAPTIRRLLRERLVPQMVPVQIATHSASRLIVRGPNGLNVEGLDFDGLVALIRALS
jgi:hypothetical protein